MPDLDWNKAIWGGAYDWSAAGEEWSAPWGSSEAQWFGSLYPRLHRMLPASRILEIAPGYGRWSRFLIPQCQSYVGMDLSLACVEACRERFSNSGAASFVQNNGLSLHDAGGEDYDLIFSFDSLVHAEMEIFEAYIPQILEKLSPSGVAFLHHSNLRGFDNPDGIGDHCRGKSVSARAVGDLIAACGGKLIIQEIINWHEVGPIDCLTLFGKRDGRGDLETIRLVNPRFTEEAAIILNYHQPYCGIKK